MTDPEKIPFLNPPQVGSVTFSHPHHTPAPQHSHNVHVTSSDPHVNIIVKENAKLKQDIDNLRTQLSEAIKPVEKVYPTIYRPAVEDSEKVKAAADKKYPKIAHPATKMSPVGGPVKPQPGPTERTKSQLTQQMEQKPKITLTPKVPHDSSING
jgi:hypothetical protein